MLSSSYKIPVLVVSTNIVVNEKPLNSALLKTPKPIREKQGKRVLNQQYPYKQCWA
jgi:hypothetical protein